MAPAPTIQSPWPTTLSEMELCALSGMIVVLVVDHFGCLGHFWAISVSSLKGINVNTVSGAAPPRRVFYRFFIVNPTIGAGVVQSVFSFMAERHPGGDQG